MSVIHIYDFSRKTVYFASAQNIPLKAHYEIFRYESFVRFIGGSVFLFLKIDVRKMIMCIKCAILEQF